MPNARQPRALRQARSHEKYGRIRRLASSRGRSAAISVWLGHIRTSAEPQVRPPPSASISTRSPRRMRPSLPGLGQRQRHRGGRGVGVPVHRHHHPLRRQPEPLAHRVDDAQVGLVRHQPVDVAPGQPVGGQRLVHRLGQPDDRVAEHLAPVHHQVARACPAGPTAPSTYRMSPSVPCACRWVDRMPRSIAPRPSAGAQEHRAGAVAEQHAGAAVLPVQDARVDLAADHQAPRAWPARIRRRPPTARR